MSMNRHELREQIFLLLFRVEFNDPADMPAQISKFFDGELFDEYEEILENSKAVRTEADEEYIRGKYEKVLEKLAEIDGLLDKKSDGWNVSRMGKVELTILRLAVYEILFDEEIPAGVAINEAVELAKKFGQDNSGAFVNAVLAKFAV